MITAERLRVLVEVAHAGSIATAARRMGFTPSALSQQLARLEREVGCTLLERRPTGASLTAAGRLLVEHGETIAGELREAHPKTRLRVVDLEPPDGYGLVVAGQLDLLITHRYPGVRLPPARSLARHPLLSDRLRLVLPADHPFATAQRIRFEDLAKDDWISGDSQAPSRICFESLVAETGVGARVAYETRDYAAVLALVRAGLGVAFVPESLLTVADHDRIVVRDLTGRRPVREIHTVHRERPPAHVATMLTLLRQVAAEFG